MQQSNDLTHASPDVAWSTAEDTKEWADVTKATTDSSAGYPDAKGGGGFKHSMGGRVLLYIGAWFSVGKQ